MIAFVALAGCTESDFQEDVAEASLQFNGSGDGSQSDTGSCGSEATIHGSADVNDGVLSFTVTDGAGNERFSQEFTGTESVSKRTLPGDSGTWTLSVDREGDDTLGGDEFGGSYEFYLNC